MYFLQLIVCGFCLLVFLVLGMESVVSAYSTAGGGGGGYTPTFNCAAAIEALASLLETLALPCSVNSPSTQ